MENYGYSPSRLRRRSSVSDLQPASRAGSHTLYPAFPGPTGFDYSSTTFAQRPSTAPTVSGIDPLLICSSLTQERQSHFHPHPLPSSMPPLPQTGTSARGRARVSRRSGQQAFPTSSGLPSLSALPVHNYDVTQTPNMANQAVYAPSALPPLDALHLGGQFETGSTSSAVQLFGVSGLPAFPPLPIPAGQNSEAAKVQSSQSPFDGQSQMASGDWRVPGISSQYGLGVPPSLQYSASSAMSSPSMSRQPSSSSRSSRSLRSRRSSIDMRWTASNGLGAGGSSYNSPYLTGSSTPDPGRRYGTVTHQNMQGLISERDVERSFPGEWGDAFRGR